MTWEEARAQFPVFERYAYLNAGTNGPLARATAEAMAEQERRTSSAAAAAGRTSSARSSCATRCGRSWRRRSALPSELMSLATSTTNGCNIVLAGLGLGPDDEVITTDGEHFGLLGALAASPAQVRVAAVRRAAAGGVARGAAGAR